VLLELVAGIRTDLIVLGVHSASFWITKYHGITTKLVVKVICPVLTGISEKIYHHYEEHLNYASQHFLLFKTLEQLSALTSLILNRTIFSRST
jgi:hypothetical protein